MSRDYYNINFERLAVLLLPTMLRKPVLLAFLSAIFRPIALIYSIFKDYAESLNTDVKSQVCYLEGLLNDSFDYYERRIVIRDVSINYSNFFLYDEGDGDAFIIQDENSGNAVIWTDNGKLGSTNPDFEIVLPVGYTLSGAEENRLKNIVNNHKLASKKYRIVYE